MRATAPVNAEPHAACRTRSTAANAAGSDTDGNLDRQRARRQTSAEEYVRKSPNARLVVAERREQVARAGKEREIPRFQRRYDDRIGVRLQNARDRARLSG